jgi:sarcosine oxidase subunit beta
MESVGFFEHFEEETGHPADFRQCGYLLLATTAEELKAFQQNVALQRKLGLEVYLLSPGQAKEIIPKLNSEDILGAAFCPTDGYADPYSVVQGFASAAKRLGVKICQGTQVIGMKRSNQVWRVVTHQGEFQSPAVTVAAGAYSGLIGNMLGIEIPVHPIRRHIFFTAPLDEVKKNTPMVVDFHTGFWFRREGLGLIFGMRNPDEAEGFDTSVDWGFLPTLAEVACRRLPFLQNIGIVRGQAGLHEDTADANAIVGKAQATEGLYLACGFSGHGFMHSPAIGRIVAELILKGKTSPDVSSLALERFPTGAGHREKCFI